MCDFAEGKAGEPRDVTPGITIEILPLDIFVSLITPVSPDGSHMIFTAPPKTNKAWSTNYDLWRVAVAGKGKPENLTKDNKAADCGPQFSPDGKKLAYRSQKRAGFEADRWEMILVDCDETGALKGKPRSGTTKLDRSVDSFIWGPDNNTIFFTADEKAITPVFEVHLGSGDVEKTVVGHMLGSLSLSRDGNLMAFTVAALNQPPEVCIFPTGSRCACPYWQT